MALADAVAERVDLRAAAGGAAVGGTGRQTAGGAAAAVHRLQTHQLIRGRPGFRQHRVGRHRDLDEAARAQLLVRVQLVSALKLRDLRAEEVLLELHNGRKYDYNID